MIPNLFSKGPMPDRLPRSMVEVVEKLKRCSGKEECLDLAYSEVTKRYRGFILKTFYNFWTAWYSAEQLWRRKGFLHCTNFNYLMRILLVKSGHFTDDDIRLRYTSIFYLSIHQYLQVKISDIDYRAVDCWGAVYGIEFGRYAHGFNILPALF